MRRGHFVQGADATYVYAISYGGVSVSDVDDLSKTIKTVVLPPPNYDSSSGYMPGGGMVWGGGVVGGGARGVGVGIAAPPSTATVAPKPIPVDAMPVDAGAPLPPQDGGMGVLVQDAAAVMPTADASTTP
jgi:hypothetical protein